MAEATSYTFAWTAPGSGCLGSIMMRQKPSGRLMGATYWNALGERINRMIAAEGRGGAIRILREWDRSDTLGIDENHIERAGFVVVEFSERLRERVQFPRDGVPAGGLIHQPETLEYLLSGEDRLEDFVIALYHNPD